MASAAVFLTALAIGALTLFPDSRQAPRAALTPWFCLVCGELGGVDVVVNILLFMPFGAALHAAGLRLTRVAVSGMLVSVAIELMQAFLIHGRDASLSDIVTNTIGAAAGAALAGAWPVLSRPSRRSARILAIGAIGTWAGLLGLGAAGLRPGRLPAEMFAFWAPEQPLAEQFKGEVVTATVGDQALDDRAPPPPRLARDLEAGALTMAAHLVSGPAPPGPVAVIRVTDGRGRSIITLGRDRDDLTFTIRTRAAALRLRSATVRLDNAFEGSGQDEMIVVVGLSGSTLWAERVGREGARAALRLGPDQGWRLLAPFGNAADGPAAALLTLLWSAGPLGVAAYWISRSRRNERRAGPIRA